MKGILHLPRQRYHRRRLGYVSPVRLRGFSLSGKFKSTVAAALAFIFTFSPVLPSLDPLVFFGALSSEASTLTWDGGGADNFWSTPENWSEDRLPTPDDIATFTEMNTKDVYIDIDISVAGIDIRSTYSSLIEARSGKRITIGSNGFNQENGRFIASTTPMAVLGSLRLQGGTFTAPSNTLSVKGNLQITNGTFEHNNGMVQ